MDIISHVQQVICFAFHDSKLLMETCQEAKNLRKIVTLFYLDWSNGLICQYDDLKGRQREREGDFAYYFVCKLGDELGNCFANCNTATATGTGEGSQFAPLHWKDEK